MKNGLEVLRGKCDGKEEVYVANVVELIRCMAMGRGENRETRFVQ